MRTFRELSELRPQVLQGGAAAVGATIYFGAEESSRQIEEVSAVFGRAHERGLFTVLWCYLRNSAFKAVASSQDARRSSVP